MVDTELAIELIKRDEGLGLFPYKDTEGLLTIGFGRCIETNGITEEEAAYLLNNDLRQAVRDAQSFVGWELYSTLTEQRQAVLISMAYNLGLPRLKGFKKFKAAILDANWSEAKVQMLDSKWHKQVGKRAERLADLFETPFS